MTDIVRTNKIGSKSANDTIKANLKEDIDIDMACNNVANEGLETNGID